MNKTLFFSVFVIISMLVVLRLSLFYTNIKPHTDGEKVDIVTTIISEPSLQGKTQRFRISMPDGEDMMVTTRAFPLYTYNQPIHLQGELTLVQTKKGDKFFVISYPEITLSQQSFIDVLALSNYIRQKTIASFESYLPAKQAALLLGIVFGIKKDMPEAFMNELQQAGVLHVIAASGMNVSMVAGAFYFILMGSGLVHRRYALILSILCVWFYTLLPGWQPSIVRAALMATMAMVGVVLGKQRLSLYILILTGYAMLLWSPQLLTDVGFQLSFLATAGIMMIKPLFSWLESGVMGSWIGDDITTTWAAQVATLPILLANFSEVNVLSILVNAFVLWTIPILMALGGIGALVLFVFEPLGGLLLYMAVPFLWFFESVVRVFGMVPVMIQVDSFPWAMSVGYYLVVVAVVLAYKRKGRAGEEGKLG